MREQFINAAPNGNPQSICSQYNASDCVCRALAFAAMGLAHDTGNVASIRNTMAALLRASERAEQAEKGLSNAGTLGGLPH